MKSTEILVLCNTFRWGSERPKNRLVYVFMLSSNVGLVHRFIGCYGGAHRTQKFEGPMKFRKIKKLSENCADAQRFELFGQIQPRYDGAQP